MLSRKTFVSAFEEFWQKKIPFLTKTLRFTDQNSKNWYRSDLLFLHYLIFRLPEKLYCGLQGTAVERWKSQYSFQITSFSGFKMRPPNAVSVWEDRKWLLRNYFHEFDLKSVGCKKYHISLLVTLRSAPTIITLNVTLTTVSAEKLFNKPIVTKPDTAKSL